MILIKFTEEKYVESVRQGKLYMNSLSWFWKNGTDGQKDLLEGTVAASRPDQLPLPEELVCGVKHNLRFLSVGFQYCNLWCATMINVKHGCLENTVTAIRPKQMDSFGDTAIVVTDYEEFVRRMLTAAGRADYKVVCGPVQYHVPKLFNEPQKDSAHLTWKSEEPISLSKIITGDYETYDAFDKHNRYEGQNEWRICLYRGEKRRDALTLDIGDIHDITVVRHKDILENTGTMDIVEELGYPFDTGMSYSGNVSRTEMKHTLMDLAPDQVYLLMGT